MKRYFFSVMTVALMATSALADTANVNVYGNLNVSFSSSKSKSEVAGTGDYTSRWRLICNACYIGFKGSEDLSEGLKANWQIETQADVHLAGTTFQARNTGIGLSGSWGALSFGIWDSPYRKINHDLEPTYATGTGYMHALIDTPGLNAQAGTTGAVGSNGVNEVTFSRRQVGSLWYVSPKFFNTELNLFYSGNGAKAPAITATTAAGNPNMMSAVLKYDADMFYGAFGFESHSDARAGAATFTGLGTSVNTSDTGIKLGAGVRPIEGLVVGVTWASLTYTNKLATLVDDSWKKSAFLVGANYTINSWVFAGAFATAGDASCTLGSGAACTATDTGATHLAFKVAHQYTKRTEAYLFYTMLNNKLNGTYNWAQSNDRVGGTAAAGTGVTAGNGTDLTAFGLGMKHTF